MDLPAPPLLPRADRAMATLEQMKDVVQKSLADRGILGQLRVSRGAEGDLQATLAMSPLLRVQHVCAALTPVTPLQAQVRAAVYTVIDDTERKEGVHMENPRLQQLLGSDEGAFLIGIMDDFCKYYGLAFTRSTMHCETSSVSLQGSCLTALWRRQDLTIGVFALTSGCDVSGSKSNDLACGIWHHWFEFAAYFGRSCAQICNSHPCEVAQWAGLQEPGEADPPLLVSLVKAARQASAASLGASGVGSATRSGLRMRDSDDVEANDDEAERSGSASFASDDDAAAPLSGGRSGSVLSSTIRPGAAGLAGVGSSNYDTAAAQAGSNASPLHGLARESSGAPFPRADSSSVSVSPESLSHAMRDAEYAASSASPDFSIARGSAATASDASPSSLPLPSRSRTGELGIKIDLAQAQSDDADAATPDDFSSAVAGADTTTTGTTGASSGVEAGAKTGGAVPDEALERMLAEAVGDDAGGQEGFGEGADPTDASMWRQGDTAPAEPPTAPRQSDGGLTASSSMSALPPIPGSFPAQVPAPALPPADAPGGNHGAETTGGSGPADEEAEELAEEVDEEDYAEDYEDDFDDTDAAGQVRPAPKPSDEAAADSLGAAGDDDVDFDGDDLGDMLDDMEEAGLEADLGGDDADLSMGDSRSLDRSVGHGTGRGGDVVDASFVGEGHDEELQLDDAEFDADFEV